MLKRATVLCLLCVPCLPVWASAPGTGHGVQVRVLSSKLEAVTPGHILSLSFAVTNHTSVDHELGEQLRLPPGWQTIIPAGSFTLRPGETTTRLLAVQVPRDAPGDAYLLRYEVMSTADYAVRDADTVTVVVTPVTKLALVVEERPESVLAGETYEIRLQVVNDSNVELVLDLDASSRDRYPARIEPAQVTLPAGQSAPVVVTVETDRHEPRSRTHAVRIRARGVQAPEDTTAAVSVSVEVIPRISREPDVHHRLPVDVTLRLSGRGGENSLQVEASGEGSLDEAETRRVDFLVRLPDGRGTGFHSWRDEVRFNFSTDQWALRLGDQGYGASRLTSYSRYGRGVGVEYQPGDGETSLGAYHVTQRWADAGWHESGLAVGREIGDAVQARANYVRRHQPASGTDVAVADSMWSVEAQAKPVEGMNLQGEYARSHRTETESGAEVSDHAYRVEWDGRLGRGGYYRAARFHAGPDYHGYYRDSEHTYASITYPLTPRLQTSASYNHYRSNLDPHPDDRFARRETAWRAGANYRLADGWAVSLNYDDFTRTDALQPAGSGVHEQSVRVGLGRSARDHSFRVDARRTEQQDRLTGETRTAWNCNLFAAYQPRRDMSLTAYAGVGDTGVLQGSRLSGRSRNVGGSVNWQPGPGLDVEAWYSRYAFDWEDRATSDQFNLRVRHDLPNDHQAVLEVRHNTRDLRGGETTYQVAYTVPFAVAVARKQSVGGIKGRVYDTEAPGNPGVPGVILRVNGGTAVTDERGHFVFPSVVPGTYPVNVDQASAGLDRVTEQQMPLAVEVTGGRVSVLDLGLVSGARVSGRVVVLPAAGNGNGVTGSNGQINGNGNGNGAYVIGRPGNGNGNGNGNGATGLANTLVELSDGRQVLRRLTDQQGRFLFESLRPGRWRLKVYDHNLPAYHYLETPEMDFDLKPGDHEQVTVRVLPRAREIRFIDEGAIKVNGAR